MKKSIFVIIALVMILLIGAQASAHEELPDAMLEITVTATNGGRVYCNDENWSALSGLEMERGTVITLEAMENKGKFVYWKDEISKKIGMSREEIFRLSKIDRETFLKVVTSRGSQSFSKAQVVRQG